MQSESYLLAVESIAKRARYIARRDNHPSVTLEDLDVAIAEVLPATARLTPAKTPEKAPPARRIQRAETPMKGDCKRLATPDLAGTFSNGRAGEITRPAPVEFASATTG
jgi:hypothetical protein